MSNNLAELIDHAITMSDELDLMFSFCYTKDSIRFTFMKCDRKANWSFTILEIESIADTNLLSKRLTDTVYNLLDEVQRGYNTQY